MVTGTKQLIAIVLPAIAYRLMDANNGHVMTGDLQCPIRKAIKQRDTNLGRYLQLCCTEQVSLGVGLWGHRFRTIWSRRSRVVWNLSQIIEMRVGNIVRGVQLKKITLPARKRRWGEIDNGGLTQKESDSDRQTLLSEYTTNVDGKRFQHPNYI
jgi:hypothetical protein